MVDRIITFFGQDLNTGVRIVFVCAIFTVIATLFDLWTAIDAVKASGGRPSSHPMHRTGKKIVDYLRLIAFVLMIDVLGVMCFPWYTIPYCVVLITVGILCREGLSMRENLALRKSNAVKALDIAGKIVSCITKEEAERIIRSIRAGENKKERR